MLTGYAETGYADMPDMLKDGVSWHTDYAGRPDTLKSYAATAEADMADMLLGR